jgi:hypothetical protein
MKLIFSSTFETRFWRNVIPEPNSGCWLWSGNVEGGYGKISPGPKKVGAQWAHRASYVFYTGKQIPDGSVIDHKCRVPCCVNPNHLRVVTQKENLDFSETALPTLNKKKTNCPKGHEYSGDNLYVDRTGRRHCRVCRETSRQKFKENPQYKEYMRLAQKRSVRGFEWQK